MYRDVPTNDELLTAINSKLSALLDLMVEDHSRPASTPPPIEEEDPFGLRDPLAALLDERQNGVVAPSPRPRPEYRETRPVRSPDLADTLEEVAKLLALNLKRKRDIGDVVADLDAAGFDRARIGELLGASPSRVDAALATYDRRRRKKRR